MTNLKNTSECSIFQIEMEEQTQARPKERGVAYCAGNKAWNKDAQK